MKTYGKQWLENKIKIQKLDGFEHSNPDIGLPPRRPHKDAAIYYNSKLFEYWEPALEVKKIYRKKALAMLMFRTIEPKNLKLKKEFIDEITSPVKSK